MRNKNLDSEQIELFSARTQEAVDTARNRKLTDKENRSLLSSLMNLYFSTYRSKGILKVVVYGTKGISISGIKKLRSKVLAVADENEISGLISRRTILPPGVIKPINPQTVFISPFKNAANLEIFINQNTVVVDPFEKLKKFLIVKTKIINVLKSNP